LENVADSCIQKFDEANSNLTLFFSKEHWRKLIWLMGFTHDIGKATKNFQEYLMEPDEKTKMQLKGDPCTNHSLISAIISFKIAKKYVEKVKINDELFAMMPFLLFLAIKRHHGNINNATSLYSDEKDELNVPTSHLDTQIRAINQQELDFLFSFIADKLSIPISTRDLPESLVEYYDKFIRKKIKKDFKKFNKRTDYYLIFQFLYSLLLSSDKEDAIFHGEYNPQRQNIDSEIVKKFKSSEFGLPDNEMDFIREDIFSETDQQFSLWNLPIIFNKYRSLLMWYFYDKLQAISEK
jgi:CRISPR-associated endonuclease/helicase Cas3